MTYHGEMLRRTTPGETQRAWHVLFCFFMDFISLCSHQRIETVPYKAQIVIPPSPDGNVFVFLSVMNTHCTKSRFS